MRMLRTSGIASCSLVCRRVAQLRAFQVCVCVTCLHGLRACALVCLFTAQASGVSAHCSPRASLWSTTDSEKGGRNSFLLLLFVVLACLKGSKNAIGRRQEPLFASTDRTTTTDNEARLHGSCDSTECCSLSLSHSLLPSLNKSPPATQEAARKAQTLACCWCFEFA